jgi:phosphate transport system substrate-binding protein
MKLIRYGLVLVLALAACDSVPPAPPVTRISCASGSIQAQGSSAQAAAVNTWIRNYQVDCPQATIAYDSIGSGAGVARFLDGTGDFAGTDSPLTPADQPAADARCGTGPAVHLPMVVGPIALAYNVAGVGDLRLRPATVAKVFAGTVSRWNDPAIAADNPGAVLPSTVIRSMHRSDSSGTTDNFTRFLATTGGPDWTYGNNKNWPAPGGAAEKGSNGVSAAVAETDGAIGYMEWSYARFHNLRTARIGNGAKEFVALTNDAAGQTVAGAKVSGGGDDLRLAIDYQAPVAGAYPIVLVTYEVVCDRRAPALLKSFLTYTSSPAGQAAVTRLGYAPLPEDVRKRVTTVVAGLTVR